MDSLKKLKEQLITFSRTRLNINLKAADKFCCISVDNESFSIACMNLANSRPELILLEAVPFPANGFVATLTEYVKRHQLEGVTCSWILAPDKYQLLTLDELPVKAEEFQSAIRWQIKKLLSFPVENAFIDSFPVPPAFVSNPKKMITVVATQASYIQPLAEKINESGLNLTTIDIQELGLRNITALFEQDDLSTTLIYLQEKGSELIITRQKLFYFLRRLDWNFEYLSNNVQEQENINHYLDKLALEIQRSFDYFQSQWHAPAPTRTLIVSLNPNILDIAAYLSQRLRFPIANLNLNEVMLSKLKLTSALEYEFLPIIGGVLRTETSHATAD
jgi:MSHA biogenesis protein MshI